RLHLVGQLPQRHLLLLQLLLGGVALAGLRRLGQLLLGLGDLLLHVGLLLQLHGVGAGPAVVLVAADALVGVLVERHQGVVVRIRRVVGLLLGLVGRVRRGALVLVGRLVLVGGLVLVVRAVLLRLLVVERLGVGPAEGLGQLLLVEVAVAVEVGGGEPGSQ